MRRGPVAWQMRAWGAVGGSLGIHGLLLTVLVLGGSRPISASEDAGVWSGSALGEIVEVGLAAEGYVSSGGLVAPPRLVPAEAAEEGLAGAAAPVGQGLLPSESSPGTNRVVPVAGDPADRVEPVSGDPPGPAAARPERGKVVGGAERSRVEADDPGSRREATGATAGARVGVDQHGPGVTNEPAEEEAGAVGRASVAGLGGERASARAGHLPAAFTRALPAAARGNGVWHTLEEGPAGRWIVQAELDDGGALVRLGVGGESVGWFERLLRGTEVLLRGGTFVLPPGGRGVHRLGLEVFVDELEASTDAAPQLVREMGSKYPTAEVPGEATVTFHSGRRARIRVHLEPRW